MSKSEYLVAINDAQTATQLHNLARQIIGDGELFSSQRFELAEAIAARFGALNFAAAKPNPRGRWDRQEATKS